jgi:signal transduction histidine kinase/ligand-binding sensor domain-containing protein
MCHWTTEDGLPSNTVISLLQTRDGYIWLGTKHGLARFDGKRFQVFIDELRLDQSDDLRCWNLQEDTQGGVWVRLPAGLECYWHGRFQPINTAPAIPPETIKTVLASKNGGLWIGTTDGLKRFESGQCTRILRSADGLTSDTVGLLSEDGEGRLWIGCGSRAGTISWQRLDTRTGQLKPASEILGINIEGCIQPDGSNRIWATTASELLCWENGQIRHFANTGQWLPSFIPWISLDGNGGLWSGPGFTGRLVHFHNGIFESLGMEDGLADSDFRALMLDREGNLWVGMGSGGVQRLRGGSLSSLMTTNEAGGRQQIDSVCAGRQGVVWLGAWPALLRWQEDSVHCFTNPIPSAGGADILARPVLENRTGQLWLGSRDHGLFTVEGKQVVRVPAADDGRTNWTVLALHEDRSGTLWIGSDSGLSERCGDQFVRFTTLNGLLHNTILSIIDAPDGSLWIGSMGGLQRLKDGKPLEAFSKKQGLLSDAAYPLAIEEDGTLWVGTPGGLNRLHNGKLSAVTTRQGLHDNELFCLLDDQKGNYWANSIHGIFRVRKADLHAVADGRQDRLPCVSYGEADGVESVEGSGMYQPNACRTPNGRMWFPTTRGVVVLDPSKLLQNAVPPPVVIEEVLADNQTLMANDALTALGSQMRQTDSGLRLPPGQARVVELRYTANSFVAPDKVRFRYRLEGVEPQWQEAGARREAFYTNLKPGVYKFLVKASNEEGVWSDQAATFAFSIDPHFYNSWPFYVGTGVLVAMAAFGFHHFRVKGLRHIQALERQRALHEERGRIARDLHDDLGGTLTGIALQLEAAHRRGHAEGEELGALAEEARSLTHEMRELAWTTNPRCDNFISVVTFIAEYAERFCQAAGLGLRLELPPTDNPRTVPAPQRYQLVAVLKESLANVSKHSSASQVTVALATNNGTLELRVKDNGTGFSINDATGGSGLPNMRERIEDAGGLFRVESHPGQGTVVTLKLPVEVKN